jgi:hypothetical protein
MPEWLLAAEPLGKRVPAFGRSAGVWAVVLGAKRLVGLGVRRRTPGDWQLFGGLDFANGWGSLSLLLLAKNYN